nr:hypothetical protein BaRGS_021164 [Batillaria attramentaria]
MITAADDFPLGASFVGFAKVCVHKSAKDRAGDGDDGGGDDADRMADDTRILETGVGPVLKSRMTWTLWLIKMSTGLGFVFIWDFYKVT